ncbi:MAG: hypothetical protein ACR2QW_11305, partial [bacterium]
VDAIASSVTPMPDTIKLVGIQKEVNLEGSEEINAFWEKFHAAADLHMAIDQEASKRAFAYYEFKSADMRSADLFIGYNSLELESGDYSTSRSISMNGYKSIYSSTNSWDTTPGWDLIDDRREPHSVIEEYQMGGGGEVVSTKVHVLYK